MTAAEWREKILEARADRRAYEPIWLAQLAEIAALTAIARASFKTEPR